MKNLYVFGIVLFLSFFSISSGNAQEQAQNKEVKQLPTCLDFSEVYARAVLGTTPATKNDEQEMQALASIMMGYVSALQDIYGNRLVGLTENDNEWTLLAKANSFCQEYPQLTFQNAVRSIPAVAQTIQALQDEEFKRCRNYIDQTKKEICSSFDRK